MMRTNVRLADSALAADNALRLEAGYRMRLPLPRSWPMLALTPHVSLAITDVRGISLGSPKVAFSHVDLGTQLTARIGAVRPYVSWRVGKRTIERTERGVPINYWGTGQAMVSGVEIPLTRSGRGIDLAMTRLSGRLTTRQLVKAEDPASLGISGWLFTVGWSGRFRGTDLLFR